MIDPSRRRVPTELGLSKVDKYRLWGFGILFVIVLATFVYFKSCAGAQDETEQVVERDRPRPEAPTPVDLVPLPIREIDPAWAREIREGTFAERNDVNERPFWLVMNYVRTIGADGFRALEASGGIEVKSLDEGVRRLVNIPETWRFRHVSVTGRILPDRLVTEAAPENPGAIGKLTVADMVLASGELVRLAGPGVLGVPETRDTHRVHGIFYKRWGYEATEGAKREMPLLVVTGVFPVEKED